MTNLRYETIYNQIIPAMATPLDEDGYTVNTEQTAALTHFLIEKEVGGLFAGGTTGEGILLSMAQRKRLHETVVTAANGRVPIIVHVGANNTKDAIDLAQHAEAIGADGILCIPPWFFKIGETALLNHFTAVAAAAPNTPFLTYDIPHLAINGITPPLVQAMHQRIPTFAGIKCSRPDAQMIRKLLNVLPEDMIFLVGNEPILLGSLAMGATGVLSGLSTAIPEPFVALMAAVRANDLQTARHWQKQIIDLLNAFAGAPRIGGIKAILTARGIDMGSPVPPWDTADSELVDRVKIEF